MRQTATATVRRLPPGLRDNLMERIREYGIDADALLSESPEAAGEALRENRESFLGENDPAIDRDAAEVTSLMGRARPPIVKPRL
ncbi:hypothetical protein [Gordonia sp. YC-JH1]|uniref:hypothetical protein n=1 Tax=Gordonia sp. YC-JH1 TaxID=2059875 RepID=UPI0013053441|nr:hypothetical protein [Gordonia sp. YC-JH1]